MKVANNSVNKKPTASIFHDYFSVNPDRISNDENVRRDMISNWIEIEDDDYIMDMKINESWRISTLTTKEIQMMIGRTWNKNYLILTKKYLVASYSQLKDKTP